MTQTSKTSSIPTQAEYESRELGMAHDRAMGIERAPLVERKDGQARFLDAMKTHPEVIAERIGWMFDGNYGKGVQLIALQVLAAGKRANRAAQINCLVAVHEWSCPARMAADAWKKLTPAEQKKLDGIVMGALDAAARVQAEEGAEVKVETIKKGDTVRFNKGETTQEQKVIAVERNGGYVSLIFKSDRKVCLAGDRITKI